MITHFIFVRLAPGAADDAGRAAVVALARAIPGAAVGVPADDSAAKWDASIVVAVADLAALATTQSTDAWRALTAHLAAHAIVVKAWNFVAA